MIEPCVAKGANLHAISSQGNALWYPIYLGYLEMTKYLVSVGVDFRAKCKGNLNALEYAKEMKQDRIVRFLEKVAAE